MNLVGNDVVEEALVVGDDEHADVRATERVHACGDDLERVDVETAVGLIEHRVGGLEHGHLENLAALLLSAGESLVHRARGEVAGNFEGIHLRIELLVIVDSLEFLALREAGLQGRADEVGDGDAGDLHRVLKRKEESESGADIGFQPEDALSVEQDVPARHRVIGMTGHDLGQGALAGAVLAHDGVNLTLGNVEGEPLENRLVADGGMQVADGERGHGCSDGW